MKLSPVWFELKLAIAVFAGSALMGYFSGYWAFSISVGLFAFIFWHLRQITRLREWLSSGAPIDAVPNLHGAAYQIISEICDIKKEIQIKQANLDHVLTEFEAARNAMPDAMIIINQQQSIEWANPAAKELMGIDASKDINQRIDNIVRDPEITNYLHQTEYEEPLELSSTNSSENDLLLKVISYEGDKKLLIVHDHRDILRLQKVRKAFVSHASHEMRTPLTVIIGYLETLSLREQLDEITKRGVNGALEQAQRLKQLIEDLLSLSVV